ncbi:DUF2017 family protein [Cellulomonas gilvus]|uniref:Uncharacterized protein n=1 Tax=Cellulomonas gilvus (strain ATCC 13127 / NRRL B-14078) TaxID=593907 RepID=F8A0Q0_CELGA|nr:DUF2017 family protein [Cellulomonas gilvus]AEI12735.1 Domain of unknown function DUF2017 [Cellulomonas gilvus ATCC 13127]
MRGFVARQGQYVARLDAGERDVLAGIASDVGVMLGAVPFRRAARAAAQAAESAGTRDGGTVGHDSTAASSAGAAGADGLPTSGWPWEQEIEPPQDPAVRRLLPDGSLDAEQAAEFRRLTEPDLRARKVEGLRTWWSALRTPGGRSGDAVAVTAAEAPAVAAALTDIRLVLADRLGVVTDEDADRLYDELALDPGDDRAAQVRHAFVGIYAVLSELQETLVGAMLADARARGTSHRRPGGGPPASG